MSNLINQKSIMPSPVEFNMMKEMASMAIKSGLLPTSVNTPEKAIIIMLKGRELGIAPMLALSHISVINGKPCMSAELMLSMIYENIPRAIINIVSTNETECVIIAQRPGGAPTEFSFKKSDADKAQLLSKKPWQSYPTAMYRARAISAMARALFPDAINGVSYTPEELGADIVINDDGTEGVKDVTPDELPKQPEQEKEEIKLPDPPPQETPIQAAMKKLQNFAPQVQEIQADADPGEYRFICNNQFKNKLMKDINVSEIHQYYNECVEWTNRGNTPSDTFAKQIANMRKYLRMMGIEA